MHSMQEVRFGSEDPTNPYGPEHSRAEEVKAEAVEEGKGRREEERHLPVKGEQTFKTPDTTFAPPVFRMFGFLLGLALVVLAIVSFIVYALTISWLQAVVQAWMIIFGVLIMILEGEGTPNEFSRKVKDWVVQNANVLRTLTGRGFFYIFLGTVEMAYRYSLGHFVVGILLVGNFIIGILLTILGVTYILTAKGMEGSLRSIKEGIATEDEAKRVFDKYDVDKDRRLSIGEFDSLVTRYLNKKMPLNKLNPLLDRIDSDRDGFITEAEFLRWWSEEGDTRYF